MNIKPLGKRILIRENKQEEITKSGIVLPGTAEKEKSITGEVLAIGTEVVDIKVGDNVIYEKYVGTEIKDGEDDLLLLELKNVLAIVE